MSPHPPLPPEKNSGTTPAVRPPPGSSFPLKRPVAFRLWLVLFFSANFGAVILAGFHHYAAALVVLFLPAPWYAFQVLKPSARGLGPAVTRFTTPRREVWLTIDDGPDPTSTPALLDLLAAQSARATFFLIGEKVNRHPELVRAILQHGHTVGNHTQTHPQVWFWCASARRNSAEIDACADALRRGGAGETRLFRPPVGIKNYALHPQLARRGLDLVLWSARGFDGVRHDPAVVLSRICAAVTPGAIILFHDGKDGTAQRVTLLRSLLERLNHDGYACVIPPATDLIRGA